MSEATLGELQVINLDICPYGDMEIVLTTSTIDATYRVSSHQLCSGSPVFRAMLGPESPFSEANELRRHQNSSSTPPDSSSSLFQITANEEHDLTALTTVLYVLHSRAKHIPKSISFENLLEIANICDYYDCGAAMRPWSELWINPLRSLAAQPGKTIWLFISWVFGDQDIFGQMTKRLSRNAVMVDGEFGVIVDGKVERLDCHIPQRIIGTIMPKNVRRYAKQNNLDAMADERAKFGQKIVLACRDILTTYDDNSKIKCNHDLKECDYVAFAGLHRGFRSENLLADADLRAHLALDSIIQIVKRVTKDVTNSIKAIKWNSYSSHNCYTLIKEFLNGLRSKLEDMSPLRLESFSREPVATDPRLTWNSLLRTGDVSTNPSVRLVRLDICKYGDMEIVLKTDTMHTTYLVCSHQLRTSSRVFRDLLSQNSEFEEYNRRRQSQTSASGSTAIISERYQLDVKEIFDPTAFAVILYIIHAGGKNLPETVPFKGLTSVAVVCEHYDCSAVLGPWYGKWTKQWRKRTEQFGCENWLFLAWVFGENQIFQTLTKKLSERGVVEDNEFLFITNTVPRDIRRLSKHIPQTVIGTFTYTRWNKLLKAPILILLPSDSMIEQRNKAGEDIVQACRATYETYSDDTTTKCRTDPNSAAGKMCDHYIYGELHMVFKATMLLTSNGFNSGLDISLNYVVASLHTLSTLIASNYKSSNFLGRSHCNCCVEVTQLAEKVKAALTDVRPLPLTTFGRTQVQKRVVSWDSVLTGAEEEESEEVGSDIDNEIIMETWEEECMYEIVS